MNSSMSFTQASTWVPATRLLSAVAPSVADRDEARAAFRTFAKPKLAQLLGAVSLDIEYERGEGDYLFYRDVSGHEVKVLDLQGGFGASMFGHNHPYLLRRAQEVFATQRPFNAQASVRGRAGLLAKRLSGCVGRATGRSYVTTFANSGAEAVDAAIKHAEFEAWTRRQKAIERLTANVTRLRLGMRGGDAEVTVPDGLLAETASRLGLAPDATFDDIAEAMEQQAKRTLAAPPMLLAIAGAFHGKTLGALRLTHNVEYRHPFARLGAAATFLPKNDVAELQRRVDSTQLEYVELEVDVNDVAKLVVRSTHNVLACFVEPIQGEGGINEIAKEYLQAIRDIATEAGFPLVFDEIQCGMGRTGSFLASERHGIRGDYYLLAKALGGGLTKISAMMVDSERYLEDFGYLHTSTYAEDDLSSTVALAALDLLESDGGRLMEQCRAKGEYFLERLRGIQARYPGQVREVRGRGLLLGIELQPQLRSASNLIRALSEQRLLGYVVAGWLLHEAGIRVAPALSQQNTIRLEPSAEIAHGEIDRFCDAFERLLQHIRDNAVYQLCRHMVGRANVEPPTRLSPLVATPRAKQDPKARPIAFVVHYMDPEDLHHCEPGLSPFSAAECEEFQRKTRGVLRPIIVARRSIRAKTDEMVDLTIIGLPINAKQFADAMRNRTSGWAVRMVKEAVTLARDIGCVSIGLGGFTSIVTNNCRAVSDDRIGITSGNSLTVAAAVDATLDAARRAGVPLQRVGILGATGNIGAMMAELVGEEADELVLVGRPAGARRLERVAERVAERLGKRVHSATEMTALRDCSVVLCASNSPAPLVTAEHLAEGKIVVCDVAVPGDVAPSVLADRPEAILLRGGILRLPLEQEIGPVAGNQGGLVFACLAETICLGLAKMTDHFSYGALEMDKVHLIRKLAKQYDFVVEQKLWH